MANVRWGAKADIVALAATDRIPVTDDVGVSDVDKYFTPAEMYTYILGGLTTTERDILDGATVTTAELNILDGVTADKDDLNILDGVTSTTAELNILDGVTSNKDELNILDGCKATAAELNLCDATEDESIYVSGDSIRFKANGGIQFTLNDGSIIPTVNDDVNLGQDSLRFGDTFIKGTSLLEGVFALDQTPQTLTALETLIDAVSSKGTIVTGAGALGLTITNGNYDGQLKYLYMITDGGGAATLTGLATDIIFDDIGDGCTLMWDDTQSKWFCVGTYGTS